MWTEEIMDMAVEGWSIKVRVGTIADVEIIVLTGRTIVLEFVVTGSYPKAVMDMLIDGMTDVTIGVRHAIFGVELSDTNAVIC